MGIFFCCALRIFFYNVKIKLRVGEGEWSHNNFLQRVQRHLKLPLMFGACQAWDQELLQKSVCSM